LSGIVDQDIEVTMLRLHASEQSGDGFVVGMIQGDRNAFAPGPSDEAGGLAYRAAMRRIAARDTTARDIYGRSRTT
jgi:hypothetical protein